jgi:hypothetical protein
VQQPSVERGDDRERSVSPAAPGDPTYSWRVEGADRQTPSETPYNKDSYAEIKNAEIIIVHALHLGVDVDSLLAQGEAAAKAAGYGESGYRVDETGLRIQCVLAASVPHNGRILVILSAPEG